MIDSVVEACIDIYCKKELLPRTTNAHNKLTTAVNILLYCIFRTNDLSWARVPVFSKRASTYSPYYGSTDIDPCYTSVYKEVCLHF